MTMWLTFNVFRGSPVVCYLKVQFDSIVVEECILHDFISLEWVEVCFIAQDKAEDS